jgi:hypothetical protein
MAKNDVFKRKTSVEVIKAMAAVYDTLLILLESQMFVSKIETGADSYVSFTFEPITLHSCSQGQQDYSVLR